MFLIALTFHPIQYYRIDYHGPNVCSLRNHIDGPSRGVLKTIVIDVHRAMIHRAIMCPVAVMALTLLNCYYLMLPMIHEYRRRCRPLRLLRRHAIYQTTNAAWLCSVSIANDCSVYSPMLNCWYFSYPHLRRPMINHFHHVPSTNPHPNWPFAMTACAPIVCDFCNFVATSSLCSFRFGDLPPQQQRPPPNLTDSYLICCWHVALKMAPIDASQSNANERRSFYLHSIWAMDPPKRLNSISVHLFNQKRQEEEEKEKKMSKLIYAGRN